MLGEADVSQGPGSVWDVGKGGRKAERDTKYYCIQRGRSRRKEG